MTEAPAPPSKQRNTVPEAVEDAVLTALSKLPADRFATAAEFAAALGGETPARMTTRSTRSPAARPGPWRMISMALGVVALGLVALSTWALTRHAVSSGPSVFDAALPDSAAMTFAATTSSTAYGTPLRNISVSPRGDFVVYAAQEGDSTLLWYRSLRDATARPIPGTGGATAPRVSPDGSRLAFLVADRVMIVPLAGGEPRRLLENQIPGLLEWIAPTVLLVAHTNAVHLSWIDPEVGQTRTKDLPRSCYFGHWVPEQRQLLCGWSGGSYLVDPESGQTWTIRATQPDGSPGNPIAGSAFQIVDGRYLVYLSVEGDLLAAPYDPSRHLVGRSVSLVNGIRREAVGDAQFNLSADGTLVFAPGADATVGRIVRLRPGSAPSSLPMEPAAFQRYDLSRDGRWLAAVAQTADGQELRIYDLRNGQHLTWLRAELIRHPLWDPAGDQLVVGVQDSSRWSILSGNPGAGGPPDTLFAGNVPAPMLDPVDLKDDHSMLAQNWSGFVTLRLDPSVSPPRFDTVVTGSTFPSVSPDGKHLLYQSEQGSRILVTTYPVPGRRWQVATDGVEPLWLSSTEILYRSGVSWYLARLDPVTGEPLGAATFWARDPRFSDTSGWSNRLSHDGGIIYLQGPAQTSTGYLRVIPGWVAQMEAAVRAANR